MNRCALTEFCRLVPLEADETRQRFMELVVVLAVIRVFRGAHVRVMRGGSDLGHRRPNGIGAWGEDSGNEGTTTLLPERSRASTGTCEWPLA